MERTIFELNLTEAQRRIETPQLPKAPEPTQHPPSAPSPEETAGLPAT